MTESIYDPPPHVDADGIIELTPDQVAQLKKHVALTPEQFARLQDRGSDTIWLSGKTVIHCPKCGYTAPLSVFPHELLPPHWPPIELP